LDCPGGFTSAGQRRESQIRGGLCRFDIITIFPGIFSSVFDFGIVRRAVEAKLIEIQAFTIFAIYTHDRTSG